MSPERFDELVEKALDRVPREFIDGLDNVALLVDDEPPPGQPEDLLGLYEGVPLPERTDGWGSIVLPDRITLFRGPLTRMCRDLDELTEEIAVTVTHEIAHYYGIDDEELHAWGWG